MTLHIIRTPTPMSDLVADRRLYLTDDKTRIVEEGSVEARWLFACVGDTIPADAVGALGLQLVDGRIEQVVDETEDDEPPADSARNADEDPPADGEPAPTPKRSRKRGS